MNTRTASRLAAALLLSAAACAAYSAAISPEAPSEANRRSGVLEGLRYDNEYPAMHYSEQATHNSIARLQGRMDRGEVKLEFKPGRGYLDSLLRNLDIDPSSQMLVYSKTSLQTEYIGGANPRAIYFNEDSSVAWENGAPKIEITVMDSKLGPVFYLLQNHQGGGDGFDREGSRCLTCHDRYGMMGGGVPNFVETSTYVDTAGLILKPDDTVTVTDETPIALRWGGWYVTGQHGKQVHLGNIQVHSVGELSDLERVRRGNLNTLDGLFDTRPYLTDKSDIVALLVLEHQSTVYNLMTRLQFKASTLATQDGQVAPKDERLIRGLTEKLVQAMLFVGAAPLSGKITGNSGFDAWFQKRGVRDKAGRSLRDLDLQSRLFRYPLSYLVYSPAFDALPQFMLNIIYERWAQILRGQDQSRPFAHLSAADRQAVLQILTDTKPGFSEYLATHSAAPPSNVPPGRTSSSTDAPATGSGRGE